jgi:hypothetical protein
MKIVYAVRVSFLALPIAAPEAVPGPHVRA